MAYASARSVERTAFDDAVSVTASSAIFAPRDTGVNSTTTSHDAAGINVVHVVERIVKSTAAAPTRLAARSPVTDASVFVIVNVRCGAGSTCPSNIEPKKPPGGSLVNG